MSITFCQTVEGIDMEFSLGLKIIHVIRKNTGSPQQSRGKSPCAGFLLLAGMFTCVTVTLPDLLRRTVLRITLKVPWLFATLIAHAGMFLRFSMTLPDLFRRAILGISTELFRLLTTIFFHVHNTTSCFVDLIKLLRGCLYKRHGYFIKVAETIEY